MSFSDFLFGLVLYQEYTFPLTSNWSISRVFRSKWFMTTRRAGAACPTVWTETTAPTSWSGEEEASVRLSVCPQCCFWCRLLRGLLGANNGLWLVSFYVCRCSGRSHVMRELIETERIYVDELLSVLLVSKHQIIVNTNKNNAPFLGFSQYVLFSIWCGYNRVTGLKWTTQLCRVFYLQFFEVRETFSLETCLRSSTFTAGVLFSETCWSVQNQFVSQFFIF